VQRALLDGLWAAAILFAVRMAAVYCGSWTGCKLGDTSTEHRQHLWMGMVTQARAAPNLLLAC
jgi:hypothetical protein